MYTTVARRPANALAGQQIEVALVALLFALTKVALIVKLRLFELVTMPTVHGKRKALFCQPVCLLQAPAVLVISHLSPSKFQGAQWLSGRVLDSRPKGRGFEPHRRHCVVVLEQDTFILAEYWFNPGRPVPL